MVDELAPVVGMKTPDAERKLRQHRVEHRQQVSLADLRRRSHVLPLRHLVHSVDVVHPFHTIQIALMHCIDAQVSGPAARLRPAALPNVYGGWARRLINHPALPVPRTSTQSV